MKKIPGLLLLFTSLFCLRSLAQYPDEQEKAFLVKRMIELNHYSPRPVDDSFSVDLFRSMINTTDPRHLLFTANEFRFLSTFRLKLDDELNGNGWAFLDQFIPLYKKSLIRADSIISASLQKPLDFTLNETAAASKDESWDFATSSSDLYNRWGRHFKFTELKNIHDIISSDSVNRSLSKETISRYEPKVREKLKSREKKRIRTSLEQPGGFEKFVLEIYLNAIAMNFDPHTNYFSPEEKEEFQSELSTEGYSFGLGFDEDEKGKIIIAHVVPGGPAWKSGELNKGDELLQLYWENSEPVEASSLSMDEIDGLLENSSQQRLVVKVKKTDNSTKLVMLRKEKINNEENIVRSFVLKGEKTIGYILLPGFYSQWDSENGSGCANDVAKEIVKLKKENIDGLILDVRFNGGGSVYEGLELTGIFVDQGPLAAQKDKAGKVTYYKDPNRGSIYDGPMALMINGQSASASEMLAASLQDYNRAVIAGSTTYGKASMQQLFPLDSNYQAGSGKAFNTTDELKITIGRFYRLDGQSIQLKGVKPDVPIPDAFDGLDIGERFSSNALPADTVKKNSYYKPLSPLPIDELARRSANRIKTDGDFRSVQKLIDLRIIANRSRNVIIPLKWDEFDKWIKKYEADTDPAQSSSTNTHKFEAGNNQVDKQWLQNDEYEAAMNSQWLKNIGEDFYIGEAFLIVSDLINLQKATPKN